MDNKIGAFKSVLFVLSKEEHFDLLSLIANEWKDELNSDTIIRKLRVTRKEFKSYILALMSHALVHAHNDQYQVTQLGKQVYDTLRILQEAITIDWKLKAVDLINQSENTTAQEFDQLINMLVENKQIRKLVKEISPSQYVRIKFMRQHRT